MYIFCSKKGYVFICVYKEIAMRNMCLINFARTHAVSVEYRVDGNSKAVSIYNHVVMVEHLVCITHLWRMSYH